MISTVTSEKCSVEVTIPAGSSFYDASRVEVEVMGVSNSLVTNFVFDVTGNITIVQATSLVDGTITINNIPLYDSSGNSIKVKYFDLGGINYEVLSTTGIFIRKYN